MTSRPTALALRALYLGDAITGLPALRMLRTALPEHHIVLAAPAMAGAIARLAGVVDDVTPALELEPLTGAPRCAEYGVDLHGNGPASRRLIEETGAQHVVAYHAGEHIWRSPEHEVQRWCRLVAEAFHIAPPWPEVAGSLPEPAPIPGFRRRTVLHPGAKSAARRWPADRFAVVARELRRRGHDVLVTGSPPERELVRSVGASAAVEVTTDLPLASLLSVIAHARLVVCGDTGIAHVASVYGTRSVVLFGPTAPALWGPPPSVRHVVLWHGDGRPGNPHGTRPDPALLDITTSEVLAAVGRLS